MVGVSIPTPGSEDWFTFTLNRKGDGLDKLTIKKDSAADPLVFSLVAQDGTVLDSVTTTGETEASLSLNNRNAGDYWLKVARTSGTDGGGYELRPGRGVANRVI